MMRFIRKLNLALLLGHPIYTGAIHKVGSGFSVQYSIPFADQPLY